MGLGRETRECTPPPALPKIKCAMARKKRGGAGVEDVVSFPVATDASDKLVSLANGAEGGR